MAKLESIFSSVMNRLEDEGRVQKLDATQTSTIDMDLAKKLEKIKKEYEVKDRNSKAYITKIESSFY